MKLLLKILFALCVATLLRLPGTDSAGGGDGGVWILPRPGTMLGTSLVAPPLNSARAVRTWLDAGTGIRFSPSVPLDEPIATLTESLSGTVMPLAQAGGVVSLSGRLLTGLVQGGSTRSDILVVDANGDGYWIALVIDPVRKSVTLYAF